MSWSELGSPDPGARAAALARFDALQRDSLPRGFGPLDELPFE